jgi:hypothetical protein
LNHRGHRGTQRNTEEKTRQGNLLCIPLLSLLISVFLCVLCGSTLAPWYEKKIEPQRAQRNTEEKTRQGNLLCVLCGSTFFALHGSNRGRSRFA